MPNEFPLQRSPRHPTPFRWRSATAAGTVVIGVRQIVDLCKAKPNSVLYKKPVSNQFFVLKPGYFTLKNLLKPGFHMIYGFFTPELRITVFLNWVHISEY